MFRLGPYAKPELVGSVEDISFNLCHTGGLALLAITGGRKVGIDADVRSGIDVEDMSPKFFAPAEVDEIWHWPLTRGWQASSPAGPAKRHSLKPSASACLCHWIIST
jgi:hypothetical protein